MEDNGGSLPLFPAYGAAGNISSLHTSASTADWLKNASFLQDLATSNSSTQQDNISTVVDVPSSQSSDAEREEPKDTITKRHHKKQKKKHKRHRSVSPPEPELKKEERIYEHLSKKIFIEETSLAPEHAYRIDCNSDVENLSFPSLYKQHVARYTTRRFALGQILDANSFTDSSESKEKKSKVQNPRYFNKHALSLLYKNEGITNLSHCNVQQSDSAERLEYISLNKRETKSTNDVNPLGIYDEETARYFQGVGPTKDSNLEETELLQFETAEKKEFYQRTLDFNKQLREDPSNVNLWLKFIAFQDEISQSDVKSHAKSLKKSEHKDLERANLERKLSILDRALKNNPASVELAVARLSVCQNLWEPEKVLEAWKQLSFKHPNNVFMWKNYIAFIQSHLTFFKVSKTIKLYHKCFQMLNSILEGIFVSHQPPPNLEEGMLDIFFLYCSFLSQCGHTERAVASVQALAEFNLFTPSALTLDMPLDKWQSFFEPFWDSGVPRFGEENAQGWASVMAQKAISSPNVIGFDDLNPKEDEIISLELSTQETWIKFELLREKYHWLPWRPNILKEESIDACEDPDRMVSVDDVCGALFRLRSKNTKFLLVKYVLEFFGLQVHQHLHSICNRIFSCTPTVIDDKLVSETNSKTCFMPRNFEKNLFKLPEREELCDAKGFVARTLTQTVPLFSNWQKKQLLLLQMKNYAKLDQFDKKISKQEFKTAKKKLKDILKEPENRNDLFLWEEYAKLEWQMGSPAEAIKVFETTILSSSSFSLENDENAQSLFFITKTYVELLLGIKTLGASNVQNVSNKVRALTVLACLASGESIREVNISETYVVPSTVLLKAKNTFKMLPMKIWKDCLNMLTSDNATVPCHSYCNHIINVTTCAAIFSYISQGISSAKEIFEQILQDMNSVISSDDLPEESTSRINEVRELCFMSYIDLMAFHTTQEVVPLSSLRKILLQALNTFPSNPQFLRMFLNLEGRAHIAGRLRRFFGKAIQTNGSPILWMHAIYAEIEHHLSIIEALETNKEEGIFSPVVSESGITWRVRSLFEKALQSSEVASRCVALWRLFLQFEIVQNDTKKAKSVFYRAIQSCPWSKVLYMDGIRHFPEEIQEVHDAMVEKELRLRTPLEEIELLIESYKSGSANSETEQSKGNVQEDDDEESD